MSQKIITKSPNFIADSCSFFVCFALLGALIKADQGTLQDSSYFLYVFVRLGQGLGPSGQNAGQNVNNS